MANDTSSDSKDKLINNRSINRKFDLLDQKMNSMCIKIHIFLGLIIS